MVENTSIKQLNITLLLKQPMESLPNKKEIGEALNIPEEEVNNSLSIEVPGGNKIFAFPSQTKEFIFEPQRVRINDKSGKSIDESDIVNDFKKIFDKFIPADSVVAYGYNFDIVLSTKDEIKPADLVSDKVLKNFGKTKILESGIRITLEKDNAKFDFQLIPTGNNKQQFLHLNIHIDEHVIPEDLKKDFKKYYDEASNFYSNF